MFSSQVHRKLWLALAGAAVLSVSGCSNTAPNETASTAKKANTAKPAAANKAPRPTTTAKPAATNKARRPTTTVRHVATNKAPQPTTMVTVPKGTAISATVGQTLASNKNHVGDTFAANLTTAITVEGKTVIPKGAHVTGRVVTVKKHELKVTLASVVVYGKSYQVETNSIAGSKSQAKNNAEDTQADKDVALLTARSQLTFKLAKPVTIPVKG